MRPLTCLSRSRCTPLTVALASLFVLTGCSHGYAYRPLTPTKAASESETLAEGIAEAEAALADCAGAQLSPSVIHLGCDNAQEVYAARYDAEVEAEACEAIASDVYRGAEIVSGPDLQLPPPSFTYRTTIDTPLGNSLAVVSCSPSADGGLLFLTAFAKGRLDNGFYTRALPTIANEGVPASLVTSLRPDSLEFFGRALPVSGACRLMGARNLSCYPYGQMDWSGFDSLEAAQASSDQRRSASVEVGATVLEDEVVACSFEGIDTTCRKVVYRLPVSRLLTLGASNVLVTYFVEEEVRGHSAQAVCSFYDDQAPEGGLAPLCEEAFELRP
ncbi:MAG: hypothetical protein AAF809_10915 [Bacteroidota bacterium]